MAEIAIVDIGSRSIVLEVFGLSGDSYKVLYFASEVTFLGKNMGRDGNLNENSMKETLDVLKEYKNIIDGHRNIRVYAVCTAAIRNARNQQEFLSDVQDVLGANAQVEVITGEKEAYYDYLGVVNTTIMRDFVMIDTGGASTEIVLVKDRKLVGSVSLPFGAANITERHFPHEFAASHNISEAENTIRPQLEEIPWLSEAKGLPIIGVGGSIRNLAAAEMKKRLATCSSLHNYMINFSNFDFMYKQIGKLKTIDRQEKLGISRKVADVILGGLVPLKVLFKLISSKRVYYSEYSLRQGIFYEKFAEARRLMTPIEPDVLGASASRLQERFNCDAVHAKKVEELAISIFEQTITLHRMGERYKRILSIAAKLHDCGEYVQFHNHQEHSFYLIKESDIYGLDQWDKLFAAIVAGFHRKERLQFQRWKYRRVLDANTFARLKQLGAFLAIAEKITHMEANAEGVKCQISPTTLQVIITRKDRQRTGQTPATTVRFKKNLYGRKVFII
ncbi:phosphatase [Clostridia bacterium]|nr:phosphatase [Clostridia bacterium]